VKNGVAIVIAKHYRARGEHIICKVLLAQVIRHVSHMKQVVSIGWGTGGVQRMEIFS
jgi:hypothetical protein